MNQIRLCMSLCGGYNFCPSTLCYTLGDFSHLNIINSLNSSVCLLACFQLNFFPTSFYCLFIFCQAVLKSTFPSIYVCSFPPKNIYLMLFSFYVLAALLLLWILGFPACPVSLAFGLLNSVMGLCSLDI